MWCTEERTVEGPKTLCARMGCSMSLSTVGWAIHWGPVNSTKAFDNP